MSDLITIREGAVALAALGTAFFGSAHCLAMCGGIAAAIGRDRRAITAYQLGRLASYSTLGALAGAFGASVLANGWSSPLAGAAAITFSAVFVAAGISLWRGGGRVPQPLTRLSQAAWRRMPAFFRRAPVARAGAIGLLTPLLPCGWLYGFALLAAGTQSAGGGALVLAALWAGSLPSLVVGPALLARWRGRLSLPQQRALAVVLIVLGTVNVVTRVRAVVRPAPGGGVAHCHLGK